MKEANLQLNFIAESGAISRFEVYTKPALENSERPADDVRRYRLAVDTNERSDFWVSLKPRPDYQKTIVNAFDNISLSKWALCAALGQKCEKVFGLSVRAFGGGFIQEVAIKTEDHPEGQEEILFQPYYLKTAKRLGFLVDFHFRPKKEIPFSRRILQLSLSLDSQNRRNASFYTDKRAKIASFLKSSFHDLFPVNLSGAQKPVEFIRSFHEIECSTLNPKRYIVGNNVERSVPFTGVKENGPWRGIKEIPQLIFIFREKERESARYLLRALKGAFPALGFEGFEKMFRAKFVVSGDPVVLENFSKPEMERALKVAEAAGKTAVPIMVLPAGEDEEAYAMHKALFTSKGIPTQVCTTQTISDNTTLKWSIANLALQIFCKAGGQPWRIKATEESCLIIGIGQAHRYEQVGDKRKIQKYFAFSILTDSSGLFQSVEMLGDSHSESQYLEALRSNLKKVLKENANKFPKVVLHTPFKLRLEEMRVLEEEVKRAAEGTSTKFAVVKINQRNRFFAFNEAIASLIPYEGTFSRLDKDEFLIWFEGLSPTKPTVSKAVPGPTHIKFLRVSHPELIGNEILLQDLLNLSGANWRGFNAKSTPVSVLYCQLVANLVSTFQEMKLPMPAIHTLNPWFL